jgi:hypothetical protein
LWLQVPVRQGPVRQGLVLQGLVRQGPVRQGPVRQGPVPQGVELQRVAWPEPELTVRLPTDLTVGWTPMASSLPLAAWPARVRRALSIRPAAG